MYYSELIHDFLEGTLDKTQQDIFFIALTNNEDFRQELIESIRIERSFSARLSQMAPSAASTYTVFSKLGFNPPTSIPVPNKIPFYRKYAQGIMASIVSVLVTSFVFGLILINNNGIHSGDTLIAANSGVFPVISSLEGPQPAMETISSHSNTSNYKPASNITTNNSFMLSYGNQLEISEPEKNTTKSPVFEGITESEIALNDDMGLFNNPGSDLGIDGLRQLPGHDDFSVSQYKGWGLEIKGSYYMSGGKDIGGSQQAEEFQNIGIGLTYQADDNLKLLLRVSNLNFDRTNEIISPDRYLRTTSQSSYLNISAGIRYYFLNFDNARLFAQSSVGLFHDVTGGTGSMQVGLEYAVSSEYSIIINGELLLLGIEHNEDFHLIPKTGANFGIGINL